MRDALGDIAALVHKDVTRESCGEGGGIWALIADLGVRGVWQPQTEVISM